MILSQIVLFSAMLLQDQTTASRMEPSGNRRNSDLSPQRERNESAWEKKNNKLDDFYVLLLNDD